MDIKVGFLVAYDYQYLYHSLPLIYSHADKIVLAIDKDRKSWSGEVFEIDTHFFTWIKESDKEQKIEIYEDQFYIDTLSTHECDTRERNMLAKFMGSGGWHLQIDSDEYFLNFKSFVKYLRTREKLASKENIYIYTKFITLYKKLDTGFLYVTGNYENIPIATNNPKYDYIRISNTNKRILTPFLVVHQSWARDEKEIQFKLKSWGHSNDFDIRSYFNLWKIIDENNYRFIRNFHPLTPQTWPALEFVPEKEITKVITSLRQKAVSEKKKRKSSFKKLALLIVPPIFIKIINYSMHIVKSISN